MTRMRKAASLSASSPFVKADTLVTVSTPAIARPRTLTMLAAAFPAEPAKDAWNGTVPEETFAAKT